VKTRSTIASSVTRPLNRSRKGHIHKGVLYSRTCFRLSLPGRVLFFNAYLTILDGIDWQAANLAVVANRIKSIMDRDSDR
jgi:hypothetical protein